MRGESISWDYSTEAVQPNHPPKTPGNVRGRKKGNVVSEEVLSTSVPGQSIFDTIVSDTDPLFTESKIGRAHV